MLTPVTSNVISGSGVAFYRYQFQYTDLYRQSPLFCCDTSGDDTARNSVISMSLLEWTSPDTNFHIGRTTFVFQPTGTSAVAPSSLSNDVVTLKGKPIESSDPLFPCHWIHRRR